MKQASEQLIQALNNNTEFCCCDLYDITLLDGTEYHIADYDIDVAYNGKIYQHDLFLLQRNGINISGTPTVDTLSVSLYADRHHNDLVKNQYVMKAIHDGTLDNAQLTLSRAFFGASGQLDGTELFTEQLLGVLPLFTGRCEISSGSSFLCKLTVKSELTGLSAQFPQRVFAPQSAFTNNNGTVTSSDRDEYTMLVPLKPSMRVLAKL